MRRLLPLIVLLSIGAACGAKAVPPQIPRDADLATREATYEANRLTFVQRFGSKLWRRTDGTYSMSTVEPAVDMYLASRRAYARVKRRTFAASMISATGGALVGLTLGVQLGSAEGEGMSSQAALTLYGAGAALIILGVALDQTWARDAARDMAATYNVELRHDLALPPLTR